MYKNVSPQSTFCTMWNVCSKMVKWSVFRVITSRKRAASSYWLRTCMSLGAYTVYLLVSTYLYSPSVRNNVVDDDNNNREKSWSCLDVGGSTRKNCRRYRMGDKSEPLGKRYRGCMSCNENRIVAEAEQHFKGFFLDLLLLFIECRLLIYIQSVFSQKGTHCSSFWLKGKNEDMKKGKRGKWTVSYWSKSSFTSYYTCVTPL